MSDLMSENKVPSPFTVDEFTKLVGLSEWPQRITSEELPEFREELKDFVSEDGILNLLKEFVYIDVNPLEKVSERLSSFTAELASLADRLFDSTQDDTSHEENSELPNAIITGGRTADAVERLKQLESRAVGHDPAPAFKVAEVMPLPGGLEPRQILNDVLTIQPTLPPTMKLFWKKVLLSEASVGMLHDAFWWMYIDRFEVDRTLDRSRLFDRLADTYVAFCYSISSDIKDKVLLTFADCLSQSVYAVFARAFPASMNLFNADFKQYIVNIIHEWITGFQPSAGFWMHWNLQKLELTDAPADNDVAELSLIISGGVWQTPDIDGMHEAMQSFGENSLPFSARHKSTSSRDLSKTSPTKETSSDTEKIHYGVRGKSHPVGRGAELERVTFGLRGQSVLVSHFLKMRQLQAKEFCGKKVSHTRVTKLPPPNAVTYRQVVEEVWKKHNDRMKRYHNRLDRLQNSTVDRIVALQAALGTSSESVDETFSSSDTSDEETS